MSLTRPTRILALALALLTAAPVQAGGRHGGDGDGGRDSFSFALLGDMPYGVALEPQFDRVIADVNADPRLRFVIHVGDVKAGSERCDDALLLARRQQMQTFEPPVVYTPGDNEWTDCHRANNGSYLPTERLGFLRRHYFPAPGWTLGRRPMRVWSQSASAGYESFVENVLFVRNRVVFATVHVVGSNNNLAPWNGYDASDSAATPRTDRIAEFTARRDAALAWIDRAFDLAARIDAAGVLIAWQANPAFELAAGDPQREGFEAILARLKARTLAFARPVALVHGDNHELLLDMPLFRDLEPAPKLRNFVRVQGFGAPRMHWIKVTVDPKSANVFHFEPRLVDGNP